MLLTYFLNDFEIVPVAPIITGITFVFYIIIIIIIIIIITVESRQFKVNGTEGTPNYRKIQTIRIATI